MILGDDHRRCFTAMILDDDRFVLENFYDFKEKVLGNAFKE